MRWCRPTEAPTVAGLRLRSRALCDLARRVGEPAPFGLLLEAAAFAAAVPALRAGRRPGHRPPGGCDRPSLWPGELHLSASLCQACHGVGPSGGHPEHDRRCWRQVPGGDDPALVGRCVCGTTVTAPRWGTMAAIGCPVCEGPVDFGFAGPADRWAEAVRLAGLPSAAEVPPLERCITGIAQLRRPALGLTSAHAAALVRARMRQLRVARSA